MALKFPRPFWTGKKRLLLAALLLLLLPVLSLSAGPGPDPLRRSLVKVFTTTQKPNYYEPWRTGAQESMYGSGCVLPGHRILTNAHVVSDQIFIQVQKEGDTKKWTAKREFVSHDCDLALLKLEDPAFFKGTIPVSFGGTLSVKDKVAVYGFPVGGEKLSITEGGVSRIEVITYAHSFRNLLGYQTDAAINPGNSGGPVFKGRKMVGVAFQDYRSSTAQNTGYFIPVPIIERFLSEARKGRDLKLPGFGLWCQDMENDALRSYFGMGERSGILVNKVSFGSSCWEGIHENDVLLSIDDHPLANDATLLYRKGERVDFHYLLGLHRIGEALDFKVLRSGKTVHVPVKLKPEVQLVARPLYDVAPSYFIFGGFVFTPFTINYSYTMEDVGPAFITAYYAGLTSPDRKQLVLLSHTLPHALNQGYDSKYKNLIVAKVNGKVISEMKDLLDAFAHPQDGKHVIEFDERTAGNYRIVLDAAGSAQATKDVLTSNKIPKDRSDDLPGGGS